MIIHVKKPLKYGARARKRKQGEGNEKRAKALLDVTPNMASNRGWLLSYKHRVNKTARKITFTNSCPQRDFLIAFRNGNTCCLTCDTNNLSCFSWEGLHQHYRLVHRQVKFSKEIVKKGFSLLRTGAASETLTNLLVLSEKRRGMVSERFLCCYNKINTHFAHGTYRT